MASKLEELTSRETVFRRHMATAFRVPDHVRSRRDERLREQTEALPAGHRFGGLLGFEDTDWLEQAQRAIDDCANAMAIHAQFQRVDPSRESQVLSRLAEITELVEALRAEPVHTARHQRRRAA